MARVLIVDDQLVGRMMAERLAAKLPAVNWISAFDSPLDALTEAADAPPDLALIDYKMPQMNGAEFIAAFRKLPGCKDVPLVLVTAVTDREVKNRALEAGATDFLSKPIDPKEFRARCSNMLIIRAQQKQLEERAAVLEAKVRDATHDIEQRERDTLMKLAKAGEYRDEDTGSHILRMARYSKVVARKMGLSQEECDSIEMAAPMHDIGKIGVPDNILLLGRRLKAHEFAQIKQHTIIGYEILRGSPSKYLQTGALIALSHHERFDGSGYPGGLAGDEIPLVARIVSVADVFDALTTQRPYKPTWSAEEALKELHKQKGKQFDPRCVDAFDCGIEEIIDIQCQLSDDNFSCSVQQQRLL